MGNPANEFRQRDDRKPAGNLVEGVSVLPGNRHTVVCPAADELAAQPAGRPVPGRPGAVTTRVIREVVVIEATGRLGDVVRELDRAMVLALADGPRGVVCDLAAVHDGCGPVAIEALSTAARLVRDRAGIPVVVASPDPQVREALAAHVLGGQLVVTASLFSAVSAVRATPTTDIERLRLAPHPTAPRAARNFVTRTLLGWRLGRAIPSASEVISDLVSRSATNAGTDIELSVAWDRGALRLTVQDSGPWLPGQPDPDLEASDLSLVAGLARAFGVTRTADGGTVVWVVLDAPRTQPKTGRMPPEHRIPARQSPSFTDARGLAGMPFCASPRVPPTGARRSARMRLVR